MTVPVKSAAEKTAWIPITLIVTSSAEPAVPSMRMLVTLQSMNCSKICAPTIRKNVTNGTSFAGVSVWT